MTATAITNGTMKTSGDGFAPEVWYCQWPEWADKITVSRTQEPPQILRRRGFRACPLLAQRVLRIWASPIVATRYRLSKGMRNNNDEMSPRDLRRLIASAVAIAINAVIVLASAVFFAAIGIHAGLRTRLIPADDASALGFAAFTIFYAVMVMVVCVARNSTLNWLLTGFSLFFFTVALILAGIALSQ